jgi:hypothetical protein
MDRVAVMNLSEISSMEQSSKLSKGSPDAGWRM